MSVILSTVEISCTTNPQQIGLMELEDYSDELVVSSHDSSIVVHSCRLSIVVDCRRRRRRRRRRRVLLTTHKVKTCQKLTVQSFDYRSSVSPALHDYQALNDQRESFFFHACMLYPALLQYTWTTDGLCIVQTVFKNFTDVVRPIRQCFTVTLSSNFIQTVLDLHLRHISGPAPN